MNNNKYMKTIIAACVAAFSLIGVQNHTVDAMTLYQVVKGDTLWELGQQYGLSAETLKLANKRQNDLLFIGEVLQIPDKSEESAVLPVNATASAETNAHNPAVSISNEEKDLLARIVEAEAKGESYEGKVAVATVVLNRVESPEFPNSITEVIYQVVGKSYAFSPVQNGEINKPASEESIRAAEEALTRTNRLNEAVFFYNPEIATDNWILSRTIVETIGNHVFAI
ncbi:cell wall hydrolase [Bacillus benzoevorans]|uniref:N-acetylmuramoyl-L-alanine amidase n=1 Tax=Bacillus benzoevorans TaxID=1456 RepID=A0A7X0LXA8_9BACI|nr:cell wall hydrolase [Bacillus benzoevorans]MBB6447415.1 N-acetylmuramoyl-L-alanine amidase [Bacillus benzoevorans]